MQSVMQSTTPHHTTPHHKPPHPAPPRPTPPRHTRKHTRTHHTPWSFILSRDCVVYRVCNPNPTRLNPYPELGLASNHLTVPGAFLKCRIRGTVPLERVWCEGSGDVVGVLTLLVGGVAQAFHGDQVVELRVQLAEQEVEGKE